MKDVITTTAGGIKCDNSSCDYRDDTVSVSDYHDWLNRPCPKCGSNLLTEADYLSVKYIFEMIAKVNENPEIIGIDPAAIGDDVLTTARFTFNGDGNPSMTIVQDES